MKFITTLGALSLLILLVGFQSRRFTSDDDMQWRIYDIADSASWVVFSSMTYLIATGLKTIGKDKTYRNQVRNLRAFLGYFTALSICPLMNAINHESSVVRIGNYIYGGLVTVIYLTLRIVKKYKNAKPKT